MCINAFSVINPCKCHRRQRCGSNASSTSTCSAATTKKNTTNNSTALLPLLPCSSSCKRNLQQQQQSLPQLCVPLATLPQVLETEPETTAFAAPPLPPPALMEEEREAGLLGSDLEDDFSSDGQDGLDGLDGIRQLECLDNFDLESPNASGDWDSSPSPDNCMLMTDGFPQQDVVVAVDPLQQRQLQLQQQQRQLQFQQQQLQLNQPQQQQQQQQQQQAAGCGAEMDLLAGLAAFETPGAFANTMMVSSANASAVPTSGVVGLSNTAPDVVDVTDGDLLDTLPFGSSVDSLLATFAVKREDSKIDETNDFDEDEDDEAGDNEDNDSDEEFHPAACARAKSKKRRAKPSKGRNSTKRPATSDRQQKNKHFKAEGCVAAASAHTVSARAHQPRLSALQMLVKHERLRDELDLSDGTVTDGSSLLTVSPVRRKTTTPRRRRNRQRKPVSDMTPDELEHVRELGRKHARNSRRAHKERFEAMLHESDRLDDRNALLRQQAAGLRAELKSLISLARQQLTIR